MLLPAEDEPNAAAAALLLLRSGVEEDILRRGARRRRRRSGRIGALVDVDGIGIVVSVEWGFRGRDQVGILGEAIVGFCVAASSLVQSVAVGAAAALAVAVGGSCSL